MGVGVRHQARDLAAYVVALGVERSLGRTLVGPGSQGARVIDGVRALVGLPERYPFPGLGIRVGEQRPGPAILGLVESRGDLPADASGAGAAAADLGEELEHLFARGGRNAVADV